MRDIAIVGIVATALFGGMFLFVHSQNKKSCPPPPQAQHKPPAPACPPQAQPPCPPKANTQPAKPRTEIHHHYHPQPLPPPYPPPPGFYFRYDAHRQQYILTPGGIIIDIKR